MRAYGLLMYRSSPNMYTLRHENTVIDPVLVLLDTKETMMISPGKIFRKRKGEKYRNRQKKGKEKRKEKTKRKKKRKCKAKIYT